MDISQQVTLVMPLFNTMARVDSVGRPLVSRMLDSVAALEGGCPRILVLDNQSSDDTVDYVKLSAPSPIPLTVIVDERRRTAEEAIFQLMLKAETPYVAIINDDDSLAPGYLRKLHSVADRTNATLTYPNSRWLGLDGATAGSGVPIRSRSYGSFRSSERNLRLFLRHRNPVPLIFGLWRTTAARDVFDVQRIDAQTYDLDNMILAKTFAKGMRVEFVNEYLFRYSVRQGHKAPPVARKAGEPAVDVIRAVYGNWTHHVKFSSTLLASVRAGAVVGQSLGTAVVISQELRRRLGQAFTWAFGITLATQDEFEELNRLRRLTTKTSAGRLYALPWRARSSDSAAALDAEISHWRNLQHVLSNGSHMKDSQEMRELPADVEDFVNQLVGVTS